MKMIRFLRNILKDNSSDNETIERFWTWFLKNEKVFYNSVKNQTNIEGKFFDKLSPRLQSLHEGIFFITGMLDQKTAELVMTPDGNLKNVVFIEQIIKRAPKLLNWKFTALKPPTPIASANIQMGDYVFNSTNVSFIPNVHHHYPDEIDLQIVYEEYKESDIDLITNGVYIYLDNYLGELQSITSIDNIQVVPKGLDIKDINPISKLKDYLIWREKEFVEKYESTYYNAEDDVYTMFEAELENGKALLASINTTVLAWDDKPSYPYIIRINIRYDGHDEGLPSEKEFEDLNRIEDECAGLLADWKTYISIGRQSGDGLKEIFFVSKEYRACSLALHKLFEKYVEQYVISYEIYKDKYWQSFERFQKTIE